jgi:hypothetical protein
MRLIKFVNPFTFLIFGPQSNCRSRLAAAPFKPAASAGQSTSMTPPAKLGTASAPFVLKKASQGSL